MKKPKSGPVFFKPARFQNFAEGQDALPKTFGEYPVHET